MLLQVTHVEIRLRDDVLSLRRFILVCAFVYALLLVCGFLAFLLTLCNFSLLRHILFVLPDSFRRARWEMRNRSS